MPQAIPDIFIIQDRERYRKVVNTANPHLAGLPTGHIHTDELKKIGSGGSFVQKDREYTVLACDIHDYVMHAVNRQTQILYPKDAAYILYRMDITPGMQAGEAGTGSAALTVAMSRAVGSAGRIYTYEEDPRLDKLIKKNLKPLDYLGNVVRHEQSLEHGIIERNLDAFFLDVREPQDVLGRVWQALKPGGHLGILLPTANQVSDALRALQTVPFFLLDVMEIFHRSYKPNAERLRPRDRMVAHTAYLIFARALAPLRADSVQETA
jgi:tRNA (adenine57-N1/adenine58-N1)-methyltransferase